MKRLLLVLTTVLCVLCLTLCSCSADKGADIDYDFPLDADTNVQYKESQVMYSLNKSSDSPGQQHDYTIDIPTDRMVVYNAYMYVEADDIKATRSAFNSKATELGGYQGDCDAYDTHYSIVYRIPTDKLSAFMQFVDSDGRIVNRYSIHAEDITDNYFTAVAQKEYLVARKTSLTNMLNSATNLSDQIAISSELSKVELELAKYNKKITDYDTNVDYAYIQISLYQTDTYQEPSFIERLSETLFGSAESVGDFFGGILIVIVALLPYVGVFAVIFGLYVLVKYLVCKARGVEFKLFYKARMRRKLKKLQRQKQLEELESKLKAE